MMLEEENEEVVAEDRVVGTRENKGNKSKEGLSGYGSLPLEIIVCVRKGWWLFTDTLRAEIVGGRERPAQLSGVDWPV